MTIGGAAILAALIVLAGWVAEVDPAKFFANVHRFTDYIGRIFVLDNGRSVFTDIGEWFWGFGKWGRHIFDTLLIAYLGTLFGAIGAFFLCFAATVNLAKGGKQRFSPAASSNSAARFPRSCSR